MNGRDASTAVESLVAEVRRALWIAELQRAARAATWAWAGIMALAAILHALTGRPGLVTALVIGGIAWGVALVAAAARRPDTATAALHADRHLAGQSAYSTWLEERNHAAARLDTPAGQRLLEWTAAAVPASRRALERQRAHWRLLRPAAAATICTAMAIAVTMLSGARPATQATDERASRAPTAAETPRLDEAALADVLATELSTPVSRSDTAASRDHERSNDGSGAAATSAGDAEALAADAAATLRREATGTTAAPGTGREAGSTRDDSAPGAGSRAAAGSMLVQRRDVNGSADDGERLAEDERVASYADESADRGVAAAGLVANPTAARPPVARREARLTPAEAAYVASWQADSRAANQEQR